MAPAYSDNQIDFIWTFLDTNDLEIYMVICVYFKVEALYGRKH